MDKDKKEVTQPIQKILSNELVQEIESFIKYPQNHTIDESYNIYEYLQQCNIGDKITYLTNNQLGTCTYKVTNNNNVKDIEQIYSFDMDIDYFDYS